MWYRAEGMSKLRGRDLQDSHDDRWSYLLKGFRGVRVVSHFKEILNVNRTSFSDLVRPSTGDVVECHDRWVEVTMTIDVRSNVDPNTFNVENRLSTVVRTTYTDPFTFNQTELFTTAEFIIYIF